MLGNLVRILGKDKLGELFVGVCFVTRGGVSGLVVSASPPLAVVAELILEHGPGKVPCEGPMRWAVGARGEVGSHQPAGGGGVVTH